MKFFFIILLTSSFLQASVAQLRPLYIGDAVPNLVFDSVLNYKSKSAKLSDFSSELTILDLWSTGCSSCIELFPYLDSLKNEFADRLDILLVDIKTREMQDDGPKIRQVLKRIAKWSGVNVKLPVIFDHPVLDTLIRCRSISQEVWIRDGKLIAITRPDEVTRDNIEAVLAGGMPKMHMKLDNLEFVDSLPLFVNNNGGTGTELIYRSMFSGYVEGINLSEKIHSPVFSGGNDSVGWSSMTCTGLSIGNYSILQFFLKAFPGQFHVGSLVVNESSDRFADVSYDDPARYEHRYCYELNTPRIADTLALRYFREDLLRFSNVRPSNEMRPMPCWILGKIPGNNKNKKRGSKNGGSDGDLSPRAARRYFKDFDHDQAVFMLNKFMRVIVVDETGSMEGMTVEFPKDLNDFEKMSAALRLSGYTLTKGIRNMEVTVIRDR